MIVVGILDYLPRSFGSRTVRHAMITVCCRLTNELPKRYIVKIGTKTNQSDPFQSRMSFCRSPNSNFLCLPISRRFKMMMIMMLLSRCELLCIVTDKGWQNEKFMYSPLQRSKQREERTVKATGAKGVNEEGMRKKK